ncbi:unnamed protein product, partial [Polarella glacialis]
LVAVCVVASLLDLAATGESDCCCQSAAQGELCAESSGNCIARHPDFGAQCATLTAEGPCVQQFVCHWGEGLALCADECLDFGDPPFVLTRAARTETCLHAFTDRFDAFYAASGAWIEFKPVQHSRPSEFWVGEMSEQVLDKFDEGHSALLTGGGTNTSWNELLFLTASAKILACWAQPKGSQFWHIKAVHPIGGDCTGTVCTPSICSKQDVMVNIAPIFLAHALGKDQSGLKTVMAREVSHWADFPLNFVIIGVDNCGSTSLRRNLGSHPDINFTHLEVHAVDEDFYLHELGRQTLPYLFQVEEVEAQRPRARRNRKSTRVLGLYQATIWSQENLRNMLIQIPHVKIIASVCDPIDRLDKRIFESLENPNDEAEYRQKIQETMNSSFMWFGDELREWKRLFGPDMIFVTRH